MLRYLGPGRILYATGMAGLGALCLATHDFAPQWQAVPRDIPAHAALADACGALLLLGAAGLLLRRLAAVGAALLALFLLILALLLGVPRVAREPLSILAWLGLFETLTTMVGAWLLYVQAAAPGPESLAARAGSGDAIGAARLLVGAGMVVFGLAHFAYADFTASMIPAWLPARLPLAYFTGACHLAAGCAVLLGIWPALAVRLEAIMMSAFIVLVHVPAVASRPADHGQWAELFLATALAGAMWTVAASFGAPLGARAREPLTPTPRPV
ncbi:MAG: DoxX family membrane protein [Proteobacteria bacterium]|nr:DoxX family membrane protein [Pseudomonadota bacterium]